jgi:molybdenum-dependent DNA-binding transcriptional regulator ModE
MTKITHQQARKEVTLFYIQQGHKSLLDACEKAEISYSSIYKQLHGINALKLYSIKELVEKLNEKYTAKEIDGKLIIVRR